MWGSTIALREAAPQDVPEIVTLLAADQLGATHDGITTDADLQVYLRAFSAISADPAHLLLVATDDGQVVATMQLSFLPGQARCAACSDRGGARQTGPSQPRSRSCAVRVGGSRGVQPRMRRGAADHR